MNIVRTQIVKIGNSRGIRIPKLMIDQTGLDSEVEIAVERGRLARHRKRMRRLLLCLKVMDTKLWRM